MKKKDFRLNYIIDDIAKNITPEEPAVEDKNDLYNIGGLLKPHIDYSVEPKEEAADEVPSIEDNAAEKAKSIGQKAAEATIDAASEETGSNLWDTIIKGV